MRDLTWLSDGRWSSRAAAHARFVIAHQVGREFREPVHLGQGLLGARVDDTHRRSFTGIFAQQLDE